MPCFSLLPFRQRESTSPKKNCPFGPLTISHVYLCSSSTRLNCRQKNSFSLLLYLLLSFFSFILIKSTGRLDAWLKELCCTFKSLKAESKLLVRKFLNLIPSEEFETIGQDNLSLKSTIESGGGAGGEGGVGHIVTMHPFAPSSLIHFTHTLIDKHTQPPHGYTGDSS